MLSCQGWREIYIIYISYGFFFQLIIQAMIINILSKCNYLGGDWIFNKEKKTYHTQEHCILHVTGSRFEDTHDRTSKQDRQKQRYTLLQDENLAVPGRIRFHFPHHAAPCWGSHGWWGTGPGHCGVPPPTHPPPAASGHLPQKFLITLVPFKWPFGYIGQIHGIPHIQESCPLHLGNHTCHKVGGELPPGCMWTSVAWKLRGNLDPLLVWAPQGWAASCCHNAVLNIFKFSCNLTREMI